MRAWWLCRVQREGVGQSPLESESLFAFERLTEATYLPHFLCKVHNVGSLMRGTRIHNKNRLTVSDKMLHGVCMTKYNSYVHIDFQVPADLIRGTASTDRDGG